MRPGSAALRAANAKGRLKGQSRYQGGRKERKGKERGLRSGVYVLLRTFKPFGDGGASLRPASFWLLAPTIALAVVFAMATCVSSDARALAAERSPRAAPPPALHQQAKVFF